MSNVKFHFQFVNIALPRLAILHANPKLTLYLKHNVEIALIKTDDINLYKAHLCAFMLFYFNEV